MCQLFLVPPLGLINLFLSKAFSFPAKLSSLLVVVVFVIAATRYQNIYHDHLNGLWLAKFKQLKREFKFEAAGVFLYKRQVSIPRESLMESLLRMDYESSTGNISSALAHLEEAQNKHDLLFNDTLKNYLDLLISVGINPESLQYANRRGEFTHYYELFLRDSNLNWDIKTYTVPTISRAMEVINSYPEKIEALENIRKDFTILMSSLVQSRPSNLLLPLMVKWGDLDRIKVLMARASLIRMILDTQMDLKFYFYVLASRDTDLNTVNQLEKIGRNALEALNDYVNQSPFHLKAYMFRGLYFLENGNNFKAKLDFEHVFKLDVNYLEVSKYLYSTKRNDRDMTEVAIYKKAENVRFRNANFILAVQLFEELLDKEWDSKVRFRDEILFNLGVIFRNNLKVYDKAILTFEEILKIPDSFRHEEARYNLIMCHYYHGNYDAMEKVTKEFFKKHGNSERVPRLMMINVVMKLMKVLKMVLGKSLHNPEDFNE